MDEMLKDMGFDQKTIDKIVNMQQEGNDSGVFRALVEQRKKVLDEIHKMEKQINTIDYCIFNLKKEMAKK